MKMKRKTGKALAGISVGILAAMAVKAARKKNRR